jgi:hypothetical protein
LGSIGQPSVPGASCQGAVMAAHINPRKSQ